MKLSTHFKSARLMQVLEVRVMEGMGVEGSVMRDVTYYIDPTDGEVLAFKDPYGQITQTERGTWVERDDGLWNAIRQAVEAYRIDRPREGA